MLINPLHSHKNRSSAKDSENDKHFCKQMKERTIDPTPSETGREEQSQQQLLANESPIWLLVSSTHTDSSRSAPFYGSHKGSSQNFPTTQENCQAKLPTTVSRRWLFTSKTISLDSTTAKIGTTKRPLNWIVTVEDYKALPSAP